MWSSQQSTANWERALKIVFDIGALLLAWRFAVTIRGALNPWMPIKLTTEEWLKASPAALIVVTVWLGAALLTELYRARNGQSVGADLLRLTQTNAVACSLMVLYTLYSRSLSVELSRSLVILVAPVSFLTLLTARYAVVVVSTYGKRRWSKAPRVAMLGEPREAGVVLQQLRPSLTSMEFTGVILPQSARSDPGSAHLPVLGTTLQAAEVVNRERLDSVIILRSAAFEPDVELAGNTLARMGVTLSHAMQFAGPGTAVEFNYLAGLPLVEIRPLPHRRRAHRLKRAFDVCFAATLLVLLAPLMLLIAIAIRLTSSGPVLYTSPRVGKGGRHFRFYKFRSMFVGSDSRAQVSAQNEKDGHIFKLKNDPRITPVGKILRRSSLDELPQLFNVLLGDMSLVGPRPLPASDLGQDGMSELYPEWAEHRSRVSPGISGLWQVRGRSDVSFDDMVRFDMQYVNDWSLSLDLRILLETPIVVFLGRGAC